MYIVIAYVRPFLLQVPHDHGIYAKTKAGAIEVPERFLNQSDPARKAAAERAKEVLAAKVTKPAAAKQTEAKKKTKKKAAAVEAVAAEKATCYEVLAKAEQAAPSKEAALVKQFVPCLPAILNACGSGRRSELCSWASTSIY